MQKIANKKLFITILVTAICAVVLLVQFIVLAVLNNKNNVAQSDLNIVTQQNANMESDINYLSSNEAKKEYARQQLGYKEVDEEIFVGE